jgi:hypothetical protein
LPSNHPSREDEAPELGDRTNRGNADQAHRSLIDHGVDHADGVVPVPERGRDHDVDPDPGNDDGHVRSRVMARGRNAQQVLSLRSNTTWSVS